MIKKGIIWAGVMVLLCSSFIFATEFARRPDIDTVCEYMLSLPEYIGAELAENPDGIYEELYNTGVDELRVYKTNDGTAKELAIMTLGKEDENASMAIDLLHMRTEELKAEFEGNVDELNRIDKVRIILANGFLIYTVYDTEGVAENAVYKYFTAR